MAQAITTRLATPTDAPSIARIYNQGIAERIATFETTPRTPEQIVMQLAARGERYPTIVVERDGRVIAWAAASSYSARSCYAGIAEFSVYVDRAARGVGAGRAALERLIAECTERGLWKLVSRVFPENTASRALCRAVGFREVGCVRAPRHVGWGMARLRHRGTLARRRRTGRPTTALIAAATVASGDAGEG